MRDSGGNPVFVNDDGSYTRSFPSNKIIRKVDEDEESKFIVYGFVGENEEFEEQEFQFNEESNAVSFATMIYGKNNVKGFKRNGEVYDVEVHEISI